MKTTPEPPRTNPFVSSSSTDSPPGLLPDDCSMSTEKAQNRDRTAMLSIAAVSAVIVGYLLVFTVLRDPNMTDKLMNGVAPAGTDVAGTRAAAAGGFIAVLGGWAAAVATRRVIPILLVLLASVPFTPLALFALALAF